MIGGMKLTLNELYCGRPAISFKIFCHQNQLKKPEMAKIWEMTMTISICTSLIINLVDFSELQEICIDHALPCGKKTILGPL